MRTLSIRLSLALASLLACSIASMAAPSTVITLDAFPLTPTSATLKGSVTLNGNAGTLVWFEWGASASYGQRTASTPVAGTVGSVIFEQSVGSLSSGYAGHFRAVASNSVGVVYGADRSFALPVPPLATTLPATDVTIWGATFNGQVVPFGAGSSFAWFEWGLTTNYSEATDLIDLPPSALPQSLNLPMILPPGHTYHYRIAAMNDDGVSYGEDQFFAVLAAPWPMTLPANPVVPEGGTLRGQVRPNGNDTVAWFEWGTNTSYGQRSDPIPLGPVTFGNETNWVAISHGLSALTPGLVWYFRVVASNSVSVQQADGAYFFVTGPPSVTTTAASAIGQYSASLNGIVNPNGASSAVAWFEWGYASNVYAFTTPVMELSPASFPQDVGYSLGGLSEATTYHYRLVAFTSLGRVVGGNQSFTTLAQPTLAVQAATDVTGNSAVLNGTINPRGLETTAWFEWGINGAFANHTPITNVGSGKLSIALAALAEEASPGTSYFYRLAAQNQLGTFYSDVRTFQTRQLPFVQTMLATSVTPTNVVLNGFLSVGGGTLVWFEWGTDTNFDQTTPPTNMGDGGYFTATINDLSPNTHVIYRAVASNLVGVARGEGYAVSIPGPPVATTLPVQVSPYYLIKGQFNPRGGYAGAWFEWGTTTNYGNTTPVQMNASGYGEYSFGFAPTLAQNTVYHYRAVASNQFGLSQGADVRFYREGPPAASILPPTNFTMTSVTLRGLATPGTEDEVTVWFEWWESGYYNQRQTLVITPVRTGADPFEVSVTLSNLPPNTWYAVTYECQLFVSSPRYGFTVSPELQFNLPSPPQVATVAATDITPFSAALQGTLYPNNSGEPTWAWFEWGTNTDYGFRTALTNATGWNPLNFASVLSNVNQETIYYYRAVASNSLGVAFGDPMTVVIPMENQTTTEPATAVFRYSAQLRGTQRPYDASAVVWFEWGSNTNYGHVEPAALNPTWWDASQNNYYSGEFRFRLTGLTELTNYHYRAVVSNRFGIYPGVDQSFTTPGAPSAVTLRPEDVNPSSAWLLGDVYHSGDGFQVWFEYGTTTNYDSVLPNFFLSGPYYNGGGMGYLINESYTNEVDRIELWLEGLTAGVEYHYRIAAQNIFSGDMIYGQDQRFVANWPPMVLASNATSVTTTSATLQGAANPNGTEPTIAWFEWRTAANTNTLASVPVSIGSGSAFVGLSRSVVGLSPGITYYFSVAASNASGVNRSSPFSFNTAGRPSVVTRPPTLMGGPKVTLAGSVTPNHAATVAWFEWGLTTNYGNTTGQTNLGAGAYELGCFMPVTLPTDDTYHYRVAASNSFGVNWGNDMEVSTAGVPDAVALPPTELTLNSAVFNAQITVPPVSGYLAWFEWGPTPECPYETEPFLVETGPFSQRVEELIADTNYYYRVAVHYQYDTFRSDLISFVVQPLLATTLPATSVTSNSAVLQGQVTPNGPEVSLVWFQWNSSEGTSGTTLVTNVPGGSNAVAVSFAMTGLVSGRQYSFSVVISNSTGRVQGDWQGFSTVGPPTVVTGEAAIESADAVVISGTVWPDGANTVAWLEWGDSPEPSNRTPAITISSSLSSTSLISTVTGATAGTLYYFRLVASNQFGVATGDLASWLLPPINLANNFLQDAGAGVWHGEAMWGDFNNDNRLDILAAGEGLPFGNPFSRGPTVSLYTNGVLEGFAAITSVLPAVTSASVAWADFDNDGRLDALIAGDTGSQGYIARLYRNEADGTFTNLNAGLIGVALGAVSVGDFNNDGRIDVVVTGNSYYGTNVSLVYANLGGGSFSNLNAGLEPVMNSAVSCADFDNDGRLDIVLCGRHSEGNPVTRLYRNLGAGQFQLVNAGLPDVYDGSISWADFDNDGWLDLLVAGNTGSGQICRLFRNNADGSFTLMNVGLPDGLFVDSVTWGDYDNDGWPDIVLQVIGFPQGATRLYHNDGNGSFSLGPNGLPGLMAGSTALGDFDNNGRLDFLLAGAVYSFDPEFGWGNLPVLSLNRNNLGPANSSPSIPTGLEAAVSGRGVTLSWNAATDAQTTNAAALSYNVHIGTTPGGCDVLAPDANLTTGFRRVPRPGNAGHRLSLAITNLPSGPLYWSVQAIDGVMAGSHFATEASFYIAGSPVILQATAASVLSSSAQLVANVHPGNSATIAWFEWGTSTNYAHVTAPQSAGSGLTPATVRQSIAGLASGVFHHFRAVASNSLGVVRGPDQSFFTDPNQIAGDINADGVIDQSELDSVLNNYWSHSPWLQMTNVVHQGVGSFQFGLTNIAGWNFSVLASTNLVDWQPIGPAWPVFQFDDPNAASHPTRFYRLRWP